MISRLLNVARDRAGAALVEFAFTLPVLLIMLLGVLQFGIFYYDYVALTDATAAGVRQFSISRLDATPYSDTVRAITNASCNASGTSCILNSANLTITTSTCTATPCTSSASSWTPCSTDSVCQSALNNAYNSSPPQPIQVTVSYSCTTTLMPVGWVNLGGICPLTMTLVQRVQ